MDLGILGKAVEQGGLFAILVLFLYGITRIGWLVSKRLLDQPTETSKGGLLVQYFAAHKEFLSGLEKRDAVQQALCAAHAKALCQIEQRLADTRLDRTMVDMAKAKLLEMSIREDTPPGEVMRIEKEIEDILTNMQYRHLAVL